MSDTVADSPIYIPPKCFPISQMQDQQHRIGIQGEPFSGKTFASLSFPNPIILSIDKKTNAHAHRDDAIVIPFYDGAYVDSIVKRDGVASPPNKKDSFIKWLRTEGEKLTPKQWLIWDGSTGTEEAYHLWYKQNPVYGQGGKIDGFAEWRLKGEFFGELMDCFKSLRCSMIYICHETPERKDDGTLSGKAKPLMTGAFADKIAGNFTDWFRSITQKKPSNDAELEKLCSYYGITKDTAREWCASTPPDHKTIYLWQTQADEFCKAGTSSLRGCPKYVVADYKSFQQYKK